MKALLSLVILVLIFNSTSAQPIPRQSIEDSVIGWMKVYHYKGVKESKKVDDKLYSPAQLSVCDSLVNWMQASYIPKGGLGDVKKSVSERLGQYNKHTAVLPQSYGAYAKTYVFLKYDSNHKMVPENNLGAYWGIFANQVPGWAITYICTNTQYYFTMPSYESSSGGGEGIKKIHDKADIPNIKPYLSFWVKDIEAGGGTDYVLLCKDNKSPFVQITKGEYLQALESAIPKYYEAEKKRLSEAEQGDQQRIAVSVKSLDQKIEHFNEGLKNNNEKYKDRLDELATSSPQPSLYDLENGRDVFSNGYLSDAESTSGRVPVYKVDPVMAELCKKDKPQWILVSWQWSPQDAVEKHMHESIINNFNFDYVYNFFFDSEKVKGQFYKPLRSPLYKEAVIVTEASENSKTNSANKDIFFFDDFSTTGPGQTPIGWRSALGSHGNSSVVAKLDGLEGNWAVIEDYTITPNQLKKPLPQNFTLSFDLVASQNFTWGAKRLHFKLAKETSPGNVESFLDFGFRPGFDGRDGEVSLETKFPSPPGYANLANGFVAPGFSNNKKNNLIKITIKKTNEILQLFIDNIKIAEYEKAIPAAHLFNALSFYSYNSGENDKYYISNIQITKD
jgi:hypothetical protein